MNKRIKILIVEDEAFTAEMITEYLQKTGYEICEQAPTGEMAVQISEVMEPDLIFMDIRLAGAMDGIEAARCILNRRPVLIAFMTGYSADDIEEKAKGLNPVAYITKPLDMDEIVAVIEKVSKQLAAQSILKKIL